MHKNKINGKPYIGISSNVNDRFSGNGRRYFDSPKFWKAIQKYGWDNFEHIILQDNMSKEEARQKEIETIKYYNSIKEGYNISEGGDVPPVHYGKDNHNYGGISEAARKKMSENHADFKEGKHPQAKPVMCIETGEVFDSMATAGRIKNCRGADISACCTGRQHTCNGYHWKYYPKENDLNSLNA